jgi:hypothetical protein
MSKLIDQTLNDSINTILGIPGSLFYVLLFEDSAPSNSSNHNENNTQHSALYKKPDIM